MKNDLEHRAEVAVPLNSRRKFIRAAVTTGGAAILSAELAVLTARGGDDTAAQIVLPAATEDVTPFKVSVPQSAIDDLKRRLASTRWPERETVGDWSQGVPLQKAQALVAYWRDKYDWRRFESRINAFPQYRTQIDGVGIHFIHVRSPHVAAQVHPSGHRNRWGRHAIDGARGTKCSRERRHGYADRASRGDERCNTLQGVSAAKRDR